MAVIKCKMCGGDLLLTEGSPIAKCEYCGSLQTVPDSKNEKMLTLFARANRLRASCEFDKAFGVYEAIVAEFPEEAEAYWGLVLCKYGIEYVDDPTTHTKIPTCHRSSYNSVMEDADFEQALENADAVARKIYREEAKQIEELRKGILDVSKTEDPYDIFICYKETADNGERTIDSVLAQDIYDALTDKGYRVFFSRITLEDKLGKEYEPYIFAALNSARVMLVVGTDYEYFNAVWVRNEWSRYIRLTETDKDKHLIPCFKDIDAYDLPKEFAKLQAQDLGKVGAVQDLLRGVDKLIKPVAQTTSGQNTAEIAPLLALGNEALEKGEWKVASSHFDIVLTVDPLCADAYLGKLMAEFKCKKRKDLAKAKKSLRGSANYKLAIKNADETLKKELKSYGKKTTVRQDVRSVMVFVAILAMLAVAIQGLEMYYRSILSEFYSNPIVYAERTFSNLSSMEWYRKADSCTQYLLQREIPGSYPAASSNPKKLTIPDGVKSIGESAFSGCDSLTSITIPSGVTSIENSAFSGCTSLTSITIPDGVTSIGESAFSGCDSLTSITIPSGVTSIENSAFSGCTSLTSITIPDGVTSIGESAFSGCDSLTSITIPSGVTSIENSAFSGCTSLTSITIPDSVTSIGEETFELCKSLTSVTIPDGVTSIGESAFSGCASLTSITIPDSVTSIGDYAFIGCASLTSITIPDSVTSIGDSAFSGCVGLDELIILSGVTKISDRMCMTCINLISITIPNSVTTIDEYAFAGCKKLEHVYYTGTEAQWNAISVHTSNTILDETEIHYEYNN